MKIVSSLKDSRNPPITIFCMFPKKKWCFSKSGNNRFTPVIYPAGHPPENFLTMVFNSQGPDHRYNPLTILLNSWIIPVSANCQQNKSGTVHRLLIIEEQEVEKSWFGRRLLKARLAILLYPVVCHSCWRVSSGKIAGSCEDTRMKNWRIESFYVDTGSFFGEEWKSMHQDPYRKEEIK